MTAEERKALVQSYLGKEVTIIIDRPVGYIHRKEKYDLVYPINYGFIPHLFALDGEEQDAYVLGVYEPIEQFSGTVIAIIHRKNDNEDKWVVAPNGKTFSKEEIAKAVHFQEQYFDIEIET